MAPYDRSNTKNTTRKLIENSFRENISSEPDEEELDPNDPELIAFMNEEYKDYKERERIYGCGRFGDCWCDEPCGQAQKMHDEIQKNLIRCIAMIGAYCFQN